MKAARPPRQMSGKDSANRPEAPALSEELPSSPLDQSQSSTSTASDSPPSAERARPLKILTASLDGKTYALRLIVDSSPFESPPGYARQDSFIGYDGNKFYCQVCKELGEIVCCDGCPRAFHPQCLPEQGESLQSLLRDDDPWFCPVCYESKESPTDQEPHRSNNNINTTTFHTNMPAHEEYERSRPLPEDDHQDDKTTDTFDDDDYQPHDVSEPLRTVPMKNGRKRRSRANSPKPPPAQQQDNNVAPKDPDIFKKAVKRRKRNENNKEVRKRRARSDSHIDRPRARVNSTASLPQQHSPSQEGVPADPLVAALGDRTHAQGLVQATPACK
jgi:hypothetical protein